MPQCQTANKLSIETNANLKAIAKDDKLQFIDYLADLQKLRNTVEFWDKSTNSGNRFSRCFSDNLWWIIHCSYVAELIVITEHFWKI